MLSPSFNDYDLKEDKFPGKLAFQVRYLKQILLSPQGQVELENQAAAMHKTLFRKAVNACQDLESESLKAVFRRLTHRLTGGKLADAFGALVFLGDKSGFEGMRQLFEKDHGDDVWVSIFDTTVKAYSQGGREELFYYLHHPRFCESSRGIAEQIYNNKPVAQEFDQPMELEARVPGSSDEWVNALVRDPVEREKLVGRAQEFSDFEMMVLGRACHRVKLNSLLNVFQRLSKLVTRSEELCFVAQGLLHFGDESGYQVLEKAIDSSSEKEKLARLVCGILISIYTDRAREELKKYVEYPAFQEARPFLEGSYVFWDDLEPASYL